jgi:predicted metalloprotease with PDZ domain
MMVSLYGELSSPCAVYKIKLTKRFNILMKRKTAMKTMIQTIGCLAILSFLSTGTMISASGKSSDEIHKKERIKNSGWIGVVIQDVNEKSAPKAKLENEDGAYVKEVVKNSPADSAGIQEGDVIIEYDGKKLFESDELVKLVQRNLPGTKVDLSVFRDGQKKTLHVIVGKKKVLKHQMFGAIPEIPDMHVFFRNHIFGMQLLTLNEQLGEYFNAPNNEGVLVEEVEHESSAEKAGFKAGDIIIRVGKKTVNAAEKVQRELRKYDEGDKVDFEVMRKDVKKTLSIEMEEDQVIHENFFFRKPHTRMFRVNPFDDAATHLEMDNFRSGFDRAQIELKSSIIDH